MKKIGRNMILTVAICLLLAVNVSAAQFLIPGGQLVGLRLGGDRVTVASFDEALGKPALEAGLRTGDRILSVNNCPVTCVNDIRDALSRSTGTVTVRFQRNGKENVLKISPSVTPEGPRLGIYLKEGINGVGTVTWYDPDTKTFATLGHGVVLSDGELVKVTAGQAFRAEVESVQKGKAGDPGQLVGAMDADAVIGSLVKNTRQGLFGIADVPFTGKPMEVADRTRVHTGNATILSTVTDGNVQSYSVEIRKIYPTARENGRNMLIRVTDPRLLELTGGIVQGMSGSPIIQDGKLVGAVTHVLVNDPTTGYGIFVENMLETAGSVANCEKLKDVS